jgi:dethiobiotin synthetase
MPSLQKSKVLNKFFITGTDTGVGKTLIAGGIAHVLAQQGLRVGVFKPIATGCHMEKGRLVSDDAKFLIKCSSCSCGLAVVNPITYVTPAAPIVAAEIENRVIDYGRIEDAYRFICEHHDIVIVEGIGGIRVPVSKRVDVLELADQFRLPVVVVARPNLGTINHTLLTADAIRINDLPFAGVVISGYKPDTTDPAEQTAARIIAEFDDIKILSVVPFDPTSNVEQNILGQPIIDALAQCDWKEYLMI